MTYGQPPGYGPPPSHPPQGGATSCALHPGQPAAGVCGRCGNFICGYCRTPTPDGRQLCPPCHHMQTDTGAVRQVFVLSILMIVHGALLAIMGGFTLLGAGMVLSMPLLSSPPPNAEFSPEFFYGIMIGTYGVMALIHFVAAGLQIWGGIRGIKYRGRGIMIAGAATGLLSIIGCYCGPTAIALFIYTLVLLTRTDVTEAFRRAEAEAAGTLKPAG